MPRDDAISLGYVLMYMLKRQILWQKMGKEEMLTARLNINQSIKVIWQNF